MVDMMEIKKVRGIVFSETNFLESSKILHILTEDLGIIGVISKGCKNIRSKLRSVSSKFTYGDFHIKYKKDGLSTLICVDVINSFLNIRKDLKKIGYATYLLDLSYQVYKESSKKEVFPLLESTLLKMEQGLDDEVMTNILELKYLEFLGVMPILESCSVCGGDNIVTLSSDLGGCVCKNCYHNEYIVDLKTISLLKMFSCLKISKIKELNVLDKNKLEIEHFLKNYYERYTGLYLKSKDFLDQIKLF